MRFLTGLMVAGVLAMGCGTQHADVASGEFSSVEGSIAMVHPDMFGDILEITTVEPVSALPSELVETATTKGFRTAEGYAAFFGQAAPSSVDFAAGDVVLFYAAGTKPTGGFVAEVVWAVQSVDKKKVFVDTQLTTPGEGCAVTMALTNPWTLVKVRAPRAEGMVLNAVEFAKPCVDEATITCANVDCRSGMTCVETDAGPECVEKSITCANVRCKGGTTCVETDAGPECMDVPTCAVTLCQYGTYCRDTESGAVCELPEKPEEISCGGIAGFQCPGSLVCVDVPNDGCDPKAGGRDCLGHCAAN